MNSGAGAGSGGERSHNAGMNSDLTREQLSQTNLYIRGLPPNTSDKELFTMCQQYGKITSTKAILDKNTNTCKGMDFTFLKNYLHLASSSLQVMVLWISTHRKRPIRP